MINPLCNGSAKVRNIFKYYMFIFASNLPRNRRKASFRLAVLGKLACALALGGCGFGISTGGGGSPNDARPSGTAIKQGQLFGGSGVSGSVLIFFSSGSSYTLRFEGLNIPTSTANPIIQVFATPNGQVAQLTLLNYTGNQNYNFSVNATGVTFQSVTISSQSTQQTVGTAQFQ